MGGRAPQCCAGAGGTGREEQGLGHGAVAATGRKAGQGSWHSGSQPERVAPPDLPSHLQKYEGNVKKGLLDDRTIALWDSRCVTGWGF